MRLIMTPVADRPESARALKTAFDLGHRVGATVKGCHIRPHRSSSVSLSPEFAEAAWRKKQTKSAPTSAKALFKRMAEESGYDIIKRPREKPGAIYYERVGSPDRIMAIDAPMSDLVVVSRPARDGKVANMFLRAALFDSARPVLILPAAGRRNIGKNVCIAWNQSPSVSRTVHATISILREAETVTIVSAGSEDAPGPKAKQLADYLLFYGIKAECVHTRGRNIEKEILDTAQEAKADMLLAGAYSKSRWRERMFGGTSEHLIYESRIPLLTMHT
ncbi:MAG: universal stress protein [Woeseiaceae bacterium]|nr:universal stress protein [Woeseiaceae bacterium]